MNVISPIFVSHGAPDLAIRDCPARQYLIQLGASLPVPKSILIVSAHWGTPLPTVSTSKKLSAVHDFGGFDHLLYQRRYAPPGALDLPQKIIHLLADANIPGQIQDQRQLDHGAWVPLDLMYPNAEIPVAQLSIQPYQSPEYHWKVGQALQSLTKEGILVLASGSATHNLKDFGLYPLNAKPLYWVEEFSNWLIHNVEKGKLDLVVNFSESAPFASENHPSIEHLLPLFIAWGAAGQQVHTKLRHSSYTYGVLSMASFEFSNIERHVSGVLP